MTRTERLFWNATGIVAFLVFWECLGRWLGSRVLSPPSLVLIDYWGLLQAGTMLRELVTSLRQMLVGFGLACVVGMTLGVLMGRFRVFEFLLTPWIGMFLVTSVAALVPLLILMLGTGFAFREATMAFR